MSKILFLILITTAALAGLNLSGPETLLPATSPIWTPTPTATITPAWEPPVERRLNTNDVVGPTETPQPSPTARADGCNYTNCP